MSRTGVHYALVPGDFPVELAERLRAAGTVLVADREFFSARRRVTSAAEIAGIRRAQSSAEAGMRAAAALLHAATPASGGLVAGGRPVSCKRLKGVIAQAMSEADAQLAEALVVSHGAQTAVGHELGFGPIAAGEPVVIDLWPRDPVTTCHADMTRTFVIGEVPEQIRRFHALTLEALEHARLTLRPGASGAAVYGAACEPYEREGLPTQRTKTANQTLERGFYHSLGHGVGLEVHEAQMLGRYPDVAAAGDVVTLEPGCYEPSIGGVRLEDLLLVTPEGNETLTDFPYDLEP